MPPVHLISKTYKALRLKQEDIKIIFDILNKRFIETVNKYSLDIKINYYDLSLEYNTTKTYDTFDEAIQCIEGLTTLKTINITLIEKFMVDTDKTQYKDKTVSLTISNNRYDINLLIVRSNDEDWIKLITFDLEELLSKKRVEPPVFAKISMIYIIIISYIISAVILYFALQNRLDFSTIKDIYILFLLSAMVALVLVIVASLARDTTNHDRTEFILDNGLKDGKNNRFNKIILWILEHVFLAIVITIIATAVATFLLARYLFI